MPAMTAWLHDNDAPMLAELQKLRDKRDELAAQRAREGGKLRDDADEHLFAALQRLQKDLERFTGPNGTVAGVRERMRWAREVAGRALTEHAQDWARTAQQVKQRHGYELRPQPGLVPLGLDPRTQLQEFLDLASHGREEPLPVRDETGELQLRPRCGIVFVLVPA